MLPTIYTVKSLEPVLNCTEIADQFHVQIRGIHGEHSESSDGIYDISNMRRLGRSEVQLVQDMYNGVKAMIREKELVCEENASAVNCGPQLEGPDSLANFPIFPEGTKSAVARFNTREIWEEFKDKKDGCGVSYKLCIFSGCKNVDSGIGVYAGSHDSYKTFAPLMNKIIEDYHGHKRRLRHLQQVAPRSLRSAACPGHVQWCQGHDQEGERAHGGNNVWPRA